MLEQKCGLEKKSLNKPYLKNTEGILWRYVEELITPKIALRFGVCPEIEKIDRCLKEERNPSEIKRLMEEKIKEKQRISSEVFKIIEKKYAFKHRDYLYSNFQIILNDIEREKYIMQQHSYSMKNNKRKGMVTRAKDKILEAMTYLKIEDDMIAFSLQNELAHLKETVDVLENKVNMLPKVGRGRKPLELRRLTLVILAYVFYVGSDRRPTCNRSQYAETGYSGKFFEFLLDVRFFFKEIKFLAPASIGKIADKVCKEYFSDVC